MGIFTCKKCSGTTYYKEKDGRKRCRACHKKRMSLYYKTTNYKVANARRRGVHKYRLTKAQYDKLVAEQQGICALCGEKPKNGLVIDHDHNTNKVRALLCASCNSGLGFFRDNQDYLLLAIAYLKKYA